MGWQYTPAVLPVIACVVVLTGVVGYLRAVDARRSVRGRRVVVGALVAGAFWASAYALELSRTDYAATTLCNRLQYVGVSALVVCTFRYVYDYVTDLPALGRWQRAGLWVVPAVTALLAFTNESHGLLWTDVWTTTVGGTVLLVNEHGPWFYAFSAWAYGLMAATLLVLGVRALRTSGPYRRQAGVLFAAALCPTATGVAYAVGANPIPPLNVPVFGFVPSSVALAWSAADHRLFGLTTIGRRRAVEQMEEGVLVVERDGRVADVNPAAERLVGCRRETVVGRVVGDAGLRPGVADALTDGADDAVVELGDRHVELRTTPVSDDDGDRLGTLALLRDVTDSRRYERRLERQNAKLEEFAGVVSHDLRNPLNAASGWLATARESGDPEQFDRVADAHDRMEALIEDLLSLARGGRTVESLAPVALATATRTAWADVDVRADAATLRVDPDVGTLSADAGRLRQLLANLFRNAVEHAGPDVTVTVGATGSGFYVDDDGPGVPPEARERVFEYGVTDGAGTGLGLAIVAEIAEAHGWRASVTESEAGGARVEIRGVAFAERATGVTE